MFAVHLRLKNISALKVMKFLAVLCITATATVRTVPGGAPTVMTGTCSQTYPSKMTSSISTKR